jgi:hypothetical protein
MAARVPARLSDGELRRFGLLVGGTFLAVALVLAWRAGGLGASAVVAGATGTALLLPGLVAPRVLSGPYRAWMGAGALVSRVTSPVVMSALYLVVITPVGVARRTFGDSPLRRRRHRSYWKARAPGSTERSLMERPY